VIAVPWRVFGSAGRRVYEERPVTQQFTRTQAQGDGAMPDPVYPKSLFRGLEAVQRIGIHGPIPRADLGRDLRRELPGGVAWQALHHKLFAQADYRFAQVNHYALRSRDSFLVPRDRGRVNHSAQGMDVDYWDRFDLAEVSCDAIRRYDGAAAQWLSRLHADAALGALHRDAVAWHRDRITRLNADPAHAPLIAAIEERQGRCDFSPS